MGCSKREGRMALDVLLDQPRRLAGAPQGHEVADAIDEWSAVGRFYALEWTRDADEFGLERIGADQHRRIAMAAPVGEMDVRRQFGIAETSRGLLVAGPL